MEKARQPAPRPRVLIAAEGPRAEPLKQILEREGYAVAVEADGRRALALARKTRPALVLADSAVPGAGGLELCRRIKSDPKLRSIPVALVMALSDPQELTAALDSGADDFILKPIQAEPVLSRVRDLLAGGPAAGAPIRSLLLSMYEAAIERDRELAQARQAIGTFVLEMERRVEEKTSALVAEVEVRRRAEEELKRARAELEMRVTERTHELLRANQELSVENLERRKAEQALRASQMRFAGILEIAEDAVISIDPWQTITLFNKGAEKIFGYRAEEVMGRPLELLLPARLAEAHRAHVAAFAAGADATRALGDRTPLFGRRKKGEEFPLEGSISKLTVAGETILTAMLRDVSERVRIEEMKNDFISLVSHELRTPLTSLRGFAELLRQREFPPEKQREFLGIIHDESVRLANLITDFLDIQRIESGRMACRFESLDLRPLLEEQVKTQAGPAEIHPISVEIAGSLPPVRADADRVRQVLSNLVSNAVKFSPRGGRVVLEARADGEEVVVSVTDEGVGVPPEAQARLFTKFFRVPHPETRSAGGTGLGLALVKDIVQLHHGRVWVESEPGRGSTFCFALPQAEAAWDPAAPADVLVVEDDPAYRRFLRELLESEGYKVAATGYAERALEAMRASPPRLVLTDVHLAGAMDGWDLLVAIRSDPALEAIPVAILSASERNVRGLALDGADCLLKPVSPRALREAIRRNHPSLRGKRVLVVDDDPIFRRQAREVLLQEGARAEEAADGREALEKLAGRLPALLLLDLILPGVDGFEVLKQLRADRRAAHLPVLVVTAKDLLPAEKAEIRRGLAWLVSKGSAGPERLVELALRRLGSSAGGGGEEGASSTGEGRRKGGGR